MRKILFLAIVVVVISFYSCQKHSPQTSDYTDKEIITKKLNDCFGWAKTKDFELFYSVIANDSSFRSITPYDKVKFGIRDVKKGANFWADPRFSAISHKIKDLKITLSESKKNAWFYCKIDDYNTWDGQDINWENVRWTGVLEKRKNNWRIVQHHFSWAKN